MAYLSDITNGNLNLSGNLTSWSAATNTFSGTNSFTGANTFSNAAELVHRQWCRADQPDRCEPDRHRADGEPVRHLHDQHSGERLDGHRLCELTPNGLHRAEQYGHQHRLRWGI